MGAGEDGQAPEGAGELRLRLFGVPEVWLDGRPVTLRRRSAVALLAYLAVTGRPHLREALATLLSDDGEQVGRLLSNAVFELRGAIGDHLLVLPQALALNYTLRQRLDVDVFRASLTAALDAGDVHAVREALRGHQEEFLAGVTLRDAPQFEAWLLQQREELHVLLVRGLQAVIDHHVRCGPPEAGIAAARRLLALEPWREEVHRQLMVLLAQGGQRSAALKQFEACRRVLAQELETAPDEATAALAARLRAGPQAVPHNLPGEPERFVGREAELGQLGARLSDPACRLISLVGLGGSGKTRLALQAARRFAGAVGALEARPFRDGVYLVPLGGVGAGDGAAPGAAARGMARAVAAVLGVRLVGPGDPLPQLAGALRDKALLLVLDGVEQLLDGVPALRELVRQAPQVTLVLTSRVRLRLLGEWELEVHGLPLPDGAGDLEWAGAGAFFLQQARLALPDFSADALSAAEREAVVRVCRQAGGLPLALLLAAAWVPVLSCAEIAAELAADVDLPGTPVRGLPERQQRVGDVLGAARDQLPAAEQAALRALPLFRGGFTREAARAVVGVSPQQLLRLMDLFLVSPGEAGRYRLNEVVSRFAAQQLAGRPGERERMEARHTAYFAGFVQQRAAALRHSRQAATEVEAELPNIQAAWEWAAGQGQVELLERLRPGLLQIQQLAAVTPRAAGPGGALPMRAPVSVNAGGDAGEALELVLAAG